MPVAEIEQLGINVIRGLAMDAPQQRELRAPGHGDGARAARSRAVDPRHEVRPHRPRRGPTAIASCCPPDTRRSCCTRCSTSRATGSSSTTSSNSVSGAAARRGIPRCTTTAGVEVTTGPARPGLRATASAWASPSASCGPLRRRHRATTTRSSSAGDGCLEEGISHEAASLAGHLGLGRLVYVYDDNHITIDGPTELAYSDDAGEALRGLRLARREHRRGRQRRRPRSKRPSDERWPSRIKPSLIVLRSHIGYPSPNETDTADAHGNPLGDDEIARHEGASSACPPTRRSTCPTTSLDWYREVGDARTAPPSGVGGAPRCMDG